jgi:hypothetical protein
MREIFVLNEIWGQDKIYILVALCLPIPAAARSKA